MSVKPFVITAETKAGILPSISLLKMQFLQRLTEHDLIVPVIYVDSFKGYRFQTVCSDSASHMYTL